MIKIFHIAEKETCQVHFNLTTKKKKLSVKCLLDKHLMTSGYPFRVYNTQ